MFTLKSQALEIAENGPFGRQFVVGKDLHVTSGQSTHVDFDGSLIVAGGTFITPVLTNDGTINISDCIAFGLQFASDNNGLFDAVRSYVSFGSGDDKMINHGTLNLIDSNVYGDLHNTSGSLLRAAGGVTFYGTVTTDAPLTLDSAARSRHSRENSSAQHL